MEDILKIEIDLNNKFKNMLTSRKKVSNICNVLSGTHSTSDTLMLTGVNIKYDDETGLMIINNLVISKIISNIGDIAIRSGLNKTKKLTGKIIVSKLSLSPKQYSLTYEPFRSVMCHYRYKFDECTPKNNRINPLDRY